MAIIKNPPILAVGDGERWDGKILNGVIEEYLAATGTVNANTFVEFVSYVSIAQTRLAQGYSYSTSQGMVNFQAIALSANKVVLLYYYSGLMAVVCTIDGRRIKVGTPTFLRSGSVMGGFLGIALDDNRVFIVIPGAGPNYDINVVVCKIDGTTITVGAFLDTGSNGANSAGVDKLDDNKVFLAFFDSNRTPTTNMYLATCTVDNLTITKSTDTMRTSRGVHVSVATLSSTRVFLANEDLKFVCTVGESGLSIGGSAYLGSSALSLAYRMTPDNALIVASDGNMYICTVNGATITKGADVKVVPDGWPTESQRSLSVAIQRENRVLLAYTYSSQIHMAICSISGTTITLETDKLLGVNATDCAIARLDESNIFVFYVYGGYVWGVMYGDYFDDILIRAATSTTFDGFTKTKSTTTIPGKVWVWDGK